MENEFVIARRDIVKRAYENGMRADDFTIDEQPAIWLIRGLRKMEEGIDVTSRTIIEAEKAGGTDHNDPWFT